MCEQTLDSAHGSCGCNPLSHLVLEKCKTSTDVWLLLLMPNYLFLIAVSMSIDFSQFPDERYFKVFLKGWNYFFPLKLILPIASAWGFCGFSVKCLNLVISLHTVLPPSIFLESFLRMFLFFWLVWLQEQVRLGSHKFDHVCTVSVIQTEVLCTVNGADTYRVQNRTGLNSSDEAELRRVSQQTQRMNLPWQMLLATSFPLSIFTITTK